MFVRYANRRFYDVSKSSYAPSSALLKLRHGSFVVIDYASGEDITDWMLAAVAHEEQNVWLIRWAQRIGIEYGPKRKRT